MAIEQLIAKVIEDSVVAGGFIFLLYHVLHKQDKLLQGFSKELRASNNTMVEICSTLKEFNTRLEVLEKKEDVKGAD